MGAIEEGEDEEEYEVEQPESPTKLKFGKSDKKCSKRIQFSFSILENFTFALLILVCDIFNRIGDTGDSFEEHNFYEFLKPNLGWCENQRLSILETFKTSR